MFADQLSRVRDGPFGLQRAVGLDEHREPIEVGALADPGLVDREIGPPHRVVDRVDTHEVDGRPTRNGMLVGEREATALVDIELHVQVPVFFECEEVMRRVEDVDRPGRIDIGRRDGTRLLDVDLQRGLVYVVVEGQNERLQVLNDLVDVLDDTLDRLVLVDDAVRSGRPKRRRLAATTAGPAGPSCQGCGRSPAPTAE